MKTVKKYREISDGKYHYSFGYYSGNKWLDQEKLLVIRGKEETISGKDGCVTELTVYDTAASEGRVIAEGIASFTDFLAYGDTVYYVRSGRLIAHDTVTSVEKTLFCAEGIGSPHITADGRYISVFSCAEEGSRHYIVDVAACEGRLLFERSFAPPYSYANHGMVCPKDKDILFYAHEGNTLDVADRLWIYNAKNGTAINIAPQKVDERGKPIDCFGHEAWAQDGCGLYFVKYRESRSDSGIFYADINGSEPCRLYSGYDYWHVGMSASVGYLTADTRNLGGDRSGVVLIDMKSGEESLIDTPKVTFKHPCHPHPMLSDDGKRLIYHYVDKYGKTAVKIAYLDD